MLSEFYPFYLSEHTNYAPRRLHFLGTMLALALLVTANLFIVDLNQLH